MEDTDFHELGRQLLTEFGSMHQRISRFADKALGGEWLSCALSCSPAVRSRRANSLIAPGFRAPASPTSCAPSKPGLGRARALKDRPSSRTRHGDRQRPTRSRNQTSGIRETHRGLPRAARRNRYPRDGAPPKACQRNYRSQSRKERCRVRILKLFKSISWHCSQLSCLS